MKRKEKNKKINKVKQESLRIDDNIGACELLTQNHSAFCVMIIHMLRRRYQVIKQKVSGI